MRVTAKATRSGDWWAVEVPEVPGVFTQTRRLDQIDAMVRDAVSLMLDGVEPDEVEIVVDPHTDLDDVVAEALNARRDADEARERANELVREAMRQLSESGFTVRDSGEILGVSPQRVSQVLAEARNAGGIDKVVVPMDAEVAVVGPKGAGLYRSTSKAAKAAGASALGREKTPGRSRG